MKPFNETDAVGYMARAGLPPTRVLEPGLKARKPKQQGRPVTKAGSKAKSGPARQEASEAEFAKERRRAGRVGRQKAASAEWHRGEKLGEDAIGKTLKELADWATN